MITTAPTAMQNIEPAAAFAYSLSELDMRNIFAELRDQLDADSRGDIDGERCELDYKVFRIEAVHRYKCHEERGGDSYCGMCESYGVVDEDYFEVRRIFDEDGKDYPGYVAKVNEYARKHHN